MLVEFCITFIKTMFFNLSSTFAFLKIKPYENINNKTKKYIIALNIVIGLLYAYLYDKLQQQKIQAAITNIICYIIYIFVFAISINTKTKEIAVLSTSSLAISFVSMFISSIIVFLLIKIITNYLCFININNNSVLEYFCIGAIQILLIYYFFKIRRFENGFTFLQKSRNIEIINIIGILISLGTILLSIVLGIYKRKITGRIIFFSILLGILLMFNWLKSSITKYYKERMKDRTVELQLEQLKEKDEIINNLNRELSNVLEINHKYNKRLSAMEKAIGKWSNKLSFNEEFAKEYSDILDSLKDLSKEYKQEFENYNILPKTNIFSIDNLLDYMKTEVIRNNIEFELEIYGDINELIKEYIAKSKLETLLGDHITDAIIAINSSDNRNRKIKVIIGKIKDVYKLSILDTGKEFEIETLLKLGLERITTHKDSGGTGIGFMTTFETLKECKASLVIEEYDIKKSEYTKSINVIFDGKSEYNINSYRAEKVNHKTRII